MIGQTLDHYLIRERIGAGGMGVVYRAEDIRLGRTVAVKMLPAEWNSDPELQRRLAHEARAASSLNHPGIASVYDFCEHAEGSFIVFEYVEGTTLRDWCVKHRCTLLEILNVGAQLADTIAAAHDRGIIHRDLKPANIMITAGPEAPGRTKILDFGLAKFARQPVLVKQVASGAEPTESISTTGGLIVGTVNYMSPEQLEASTADARSDLYSLGLVLYELATGRNPFVGGTPASTIGNILNREPPPILEYNGAAPAELDRILQKCLRKEREERYQSAQDLFADLVRLRKESVLRHAAPAPAHRETEPIPALRISRGWARGIFSLIQVAYLAMYAVSFYKFTEFLNRLENGPAALLRYAIMLSIICGSAVRLYLLTAVAFDYDELGRKFRLLFPLVLAIDLVWAASPLLLLDELRGFVIVASAALAFLPFSQRTVLASAYMSKGGRSSAVRRRETFLS